MKKKVLALLLCATLLIGNTAVCGFASAHEARTEVDGARWFPCEPGRENDMLWEAECLQDGCVCQAFDADPEETGNKNFLDTTYGEDGSLTLTRNGNDGNEFYWPRIRTLWLETYPTMDITKANTLYFDFEAINCQWNLCIGMNGVVVKLAKAITAACGGAALNSSDDDGAAGIYKGSINLTEVFADIIATEMGTESWVGAKAITQMGANAQVPQIQIFYSGTVDPNAYLKINELYISTPDDVNGANCEYMDMGAIYGDEFYEFIEPPAEDVLLGDINDNSTVNMRDAFALYVSVSGGAGLTEAQKLVADMNGDGVYNMRDAFALYKIASGG